MKLHDFAWGFLISSRKLIQTIYILKSCLEYRNAFKKLIRENWSTRILFGGLLANLNSLEDLFTKAFLVSCSSETNNSECYMVISIYSQINEVFNQQYKYVSHSHSPRNQPAHVLLEALNLLTNPRHVCSVCSKRKTRRNCSFDKNWTSTKLPLVS